MPKWIIRKRHPSDPESYVLEAYRLEIVITKIDHHSELFEEIYENNVKSYYVADIQTRYDFFSEQKRENPYLLASLRNTSLEATMNVSHRVLMSILKNIAKEAGDGEHIIDREAKETFLFHDFF